MQHRRRVRRAEERVHFTRNPHHRHTIGTIGGDIEVQDDFIQKIFHGLADRGIGFEDVNAALVGGDAQLISRADHALRGNPAEFTATNITYREPAARRDVRHDVANSQIGCAGDDRHHASAQVNPSHL